MSIFYYTLIFTQSSLKPEHRLMSHHRLVRSWFYLFFKKIAKKNSFPRIIPVPAGEEGGGIFSACLFGQLWKPSSLSPGSSSRGPPRTSLWEPPLAYGKKDIEKSVSTLYPRAFLSTDKNTQPKLTVKRWTVNKIHWKVCLGGSRSRGHRCGAGTGSR